MSLIDNSMWSQPIKLWGIDSHSKVKAFVENHRDIECLNLSGIHNLTNLQVKSYLETCENLYKLVIEGNEVDTAIIDVIKNNGPHIKYVFLKNCYVFDNDEQKKKFYDELPEISLTVKNVRHLIVNHLSNFG